MKRLLTPILFFAAIHLTRAQVVDQDVPRTARDQVIPDDLIVQGSECVGFDCVNNENFGFHTIRLKENNLRIGFDDTSVGTFPSNDWEIEINASASGGSNHFAINDVTGARNPFRIEAGAASNALFIDNTSRIGLRTSTPVLDLHIATSNTPGMRLEQTNAGGFTAQTWDIAGNEANFFIRDVTGGSRLPFRIRPGAPTSSIDISADGDVGIGTASPNHRLSVFNGANATNQAIFALQPSSATSFSSVFATLYLANDNDTDNNFARLNFGDGDDQATAAVASQIQSHANNGGDLSFWTRPSSGGAIAQRMTVQANGNVMIGTGTATELLSVNGTAGKPGGGTWATFSDRNLKKDINEYKDGLAQIMKINPVSFKYNGKGGISDTESEYVGIIAQDMSEIAPYMVREVALPSSSFDNTRSSFDQADETVRNSNSKLENYYQFDPNALTYMLINSTKEQQNMIETQQEQLIVQEERITELEATVAELKNLIMDLKNSVEVNLSGEDLGYLGQNVPNPYQGETSITYVIPGKAKDSAINIYDAAGKFIKSVPIKQTGKGQLRVNADNLPGGVYSYTLVVDGKVMATKQMMLQH